MDKDRQNAARPRPWRPVLVGIGALVLVFAGYVLWLAFLSPEAAREREAQKNLAAAQNFMKTYETAMTADTYGGKTPQETLDLFIDALKQGDVDLASKYFMLKADGSVDEKWVNALNQIKNDDVLVPLYNKLLRATPYTKDISSPEDYKFVVINNKTGNLEAYINLEFNKYSGIWKIESM